MPGKTKSAKRGKDTSAEVTHISGQGVWLIFDEIEYYLPYSKFPWFRAATIDQVLKLERAGKSHLYWPELDIDLDLDRIRRPDRYPLVSKPG